MCCGVVDTLPKKRKNSSRPGTPAGSGGRALAPLPAPFPFTGPNSFSSCSGGRAASYRIATQVTYGMASADLRARGAGRPPSQLPPALCPICALGSAALLTGNLRLRPARRHPCAAPRTRSGPASCSAPALRAADRAALRSASAPAASPGVAAAAAAPASPACLCPPRLDRVERGAGREAPLPSLDNIPTRIYQQSGYHPGYAWAAHSLAHAYCCTHCSCILLCTLMQHAGPASGYHPVQDLDNSLHWYLQSVMLCLLIPSAWIPLPARYPLDTSSLDTIQDIAHFCTLLHTLHFCILLCTLHTSAHCTLLHTALTAHAHCTLLHTSAQFCTLLHTAHTLTLFSYTAVICVV